MASSFLRNALKSMGLFMEFSSYVCINRTSFISGTMFIINISSICFLMVFADAVND